MYLNLVMLSVILNWNSIYSLLSNPSILFQQPINFLLIICDSPLKLHLGIH